MKKIHKSFYLLRSVTVSFVVTLLTLGTVYFFYSNSLQSPKIVLEKETNYYLARVVDTNIFNETEARILFLDFDSHSIEYKNSENSPPSYLSIYPVFKILKPDGVNKINVIGGGAYTLPKNLVSFYKNSNVDVVEVDEQVSRIAREYFYVKNPNIKTITSDARVYFKKSDKKYDLVFGDAYNSFISAPWHLVTFEFTELVKTKLNDGGIYAINFISSIDGENSLFFKSMAKTFSKVFPNYYIFAMGDDPLSVQNIVLIGVKEEINSKTYEQFKEELLLSEKTTPFSLLLVDKNNVNTDKAILLKDDFAPVERLMLPVMKNYFSKYLVFYNSVFK